jgi:uncharacterized protein YijF (DUF1287 family)
MHMIDDEETGETLTVVLRNGVTLEGVIFDITDHEDGERYVILDGVGAGTRTRRVWLFRDREVAATGKIPTSGREE